jgi:glycine cleavage system pyridoxal-binding protein P
LKSSTTTGLTTASSSTLDPSISVNEAAVLLARYNRLMASSMPFVVIPDGTEPFLMQVIATVAFFHDLPKQQVMVKDLMRQISEKMMLRNDKSLELLQGILILIAW